MAPPDAVAATAIARKAGMPRRIVTILEGESLVNDATALICLRDAIAAIAGSVSAAEIAGGFLLAAGGGVVVGLAAAYMLTELRKRIRNVPINTSTSLVAPLGAGRIWAGRAVILLAVLMLRPVWVFPATYLPRLIPAVQRNDPAPPWQFAAIVSWAGMCGVATAAGVARLQELRTEGDPPEVVAMLKRRTQERGLAAWERLGRPTAEAATPSSSQPGPGR